MTLKPIPTLGLLLTSAITSLVAQDLVLPTKIDPATISVDEYVRAMPDGHLQLRGQRARFWAVIGGIPNDAGVTNGDKPEQISAKVAKSRADSDALVARFTELGFNMCRMWRYAENDYVAGDGSNEDSLDYFVAQMKAKGLRIWVPSVSWVDAQPHDSALINEPASAAAWTEAMTDAETRKIGHNWIARVWDPRMEAAQCRGITRRLDHFNHYTGLRWADDPVFAAWELTNEEWWMPKMMGGAWQQLPQFFQHALAVKWQEFLTAKYGDETKLVARWGFLLPGESLKTGTIGLLPVAGAMKLGDAGMDPTARKALEAIGSAQQSITRDDVTRHRGEDLIEFYMDLQLAHKQRLADHLKSLGRSAKLSPLCYDTGIGYQIQSQYLHQHADAVAHDAYINGWAKSPTNQRFPWQTGLEEYPRISEDVPWLEHNKIVGKPYFCYETQIQQPAKFRAEFPLRILALASIQDWDIVAWHYWGGVGDITTSPKPFERALDVSVGGHPQGYHYTYDEVQNAMMRAAGLAFRQVAVAAAPTPTEFTFGRRSLYDPASMDYGASYGPMGQHMLYTTYQYGVRLSIDPKREDDDVKGPYLRLDGASVPAVIKPNDQITFDTLKANLQFDAPAMRAFTGFLAHIGGRWTSRLGTTLSDVQFSVPKDMPYPEGIADEQYVGFALYSTDGKSLNESKSAACSLVSTSFNTGFKLKNDHGNISGSNAGTLPVLTARVGGTITDTAIAGMKWEFHTWSGSVLAKGTIAADGVLKIPSDQPVWYVSLTR